MKKLLSIFLSISLIILSCTVVYAETFNPFLSIANVGTTVNKTIPFTLPTGTTKWIYVNYPEVLTSDLALTSLGDYNRGNKYLTKTTINSAYQYEVFESFRNNTGINVNFGVQIYNGTTSTATITVSKLGAKNNNTGLSGTDLFGGAAKDFILSSLNNTYTIAPGASTWIYDSGAIAGTDKSHNVYMQFKSNVSNVTCFTYNFNTRTNINGTATQYAWNDGLVYNGNAATSCVNDTNISLNVSDMTSTAVVYKSNNRYENSGSDIIPIRYSEPDGILFSSPSDNLANWGAHYKYNVTVTNNTASSKVIKAYVGTLTPDPLCQIPIIKYGSTVYYGKLIYSSTTGAWNFMTDTLAAGAYKTYSYEYIYGSNSGGPTIWEWKAQ